MSIGSVVAIAFIVMLAVWGSDATPPEDAEVSIFTVSRNAEPADIEEKISGQKFMNGRPLFGLFLMLHGGYDNIAPGGYRIWDEMSTWTLVSELTGDPPLLWITIPEGLRREQIADRLAETFLWDTTERDAFLLADVPHPYELAEGFYFPDTYLIPVDETPDKVARRFISRFNENFDPLLPALREQNIKNDTAIKLASIIQREAGGKSDMPLIAGVLWNRLLIDMKLEVDATLQYMRGDEGDGYWAPIDVAIKKQDSPYNTYMYPGLPPHPISNPGLDAINAVIYPQETDCLFYLHDDDRQIHCSKTYEGHLENIERYLRD